MSVALVAAAVFVAFVPATFAIVALLIYATPFLEWGVQHPLQAFLACGLVSFVLMMVGYMVDEL
jgi:hypothetical protein